MKAILEFNLPQEQEDFEDASNGWKWQHAMWQLDAFQETRNELHRILNEENLEMR